MQIPFFVTDSKAGIPSNVRVESMVRLHVHDLHTERAPSHRRPPVSYVELMKAADRKTGAPIALAFDEAGQTIDMERIFRQLLERREKKFGKLREVLHSRVQTMGARTRVPVAIWIKCDEALETDDKKSKGETKRPTRQTLARHKAIGDATRDFARDLGREKGVRACRADALAPVAYAELTQQQIETIAVRPQVFHMFLHETEGIEDLAESIAIANSDYVHNTLGFKGSGVKVAVWDHSPDDRTHLSIEAKFKPWILTTTSQHSRLMHAIIKNIEPGRPHGHAPSCLLHSANTQRTGALSWAARIKGCTVISQSFHRLPGGPDSPSMSFDDYYKDRLALQWPYPTICQAAGNFWQGDADNIQPPDNEYVNHKGYNGITVGNHYDTAGAMSGDSVFRNPSSMHGDRELPEIAANGKQVTAVGFTADGTSLAAPAVAGCVALFQSVNGTLKSWPEGCRAILLAGAKKNVDGQTWWRDVVANVDARDGTGAVDALEGVGIAKQRRSRDASATTKGWDVGKLESSDIGSNKQATFSYFVKLSSRVSAPRHVKVALAWSNPSGSGALAVDLDLQVFDSHSTLVGFSGSWDNSYEIAEFEGEPAETYTIKIRRWSGSEDVWYGIAWTVTESVFR